MIHALAGPALNSRASLDPTVLDLGMRRLGAQKNQRAWTIPSHSEGRVDRRKERLGVGVVVVCREERDHCLLIVLHDPHEAVEDCSNSALIPGLDHDAGWLDVAQLLRVEGFVRLHNDKQRSRR